MDDYDFQFFDPFADFSSAYSLYKKQNYRVMCFVGESIKKVLIIVKSSRRKIYPYGSSVDNLHQVIGFCSYYEKKGFDVEILGNYPKTIVKNHPELRRFVKFEWFNGKVEYSIEGPTIFFKMDNGE